jgi:DNA-directed RNA polymerase III subunit RPC3
MGADAETTRLCVHIVQIHFGPLTASVASVLLTRGRLAIPTLLRLATTKPRITRAALLILIQHQLVRHFDSEDDGETLEFNVDVCFMRLRLGRYSFLAKDLLGDEVRSLSTIMQLLMTPPGRRDC